MSIWQHVLSARNQAHHTDLASQQELMLARSMAQASVLTNMPLLTYIVVMQPAAPATPEPEEEKPKEKPKDPLAALPPSKMVLDSWKRLYSNTPAAKFQEICVSGLWNGADIPNSPTQEVRSLLPFS